MEFQTRLKTSVNGALHVANGGGLRTEAVQVGWGGVWQVTVTYQAYSYHSQAKATVTYQAYSYHSQANVWACDKYALESFAKNW